MSVRKNLRPPKNIIFDTPTSGELMDELNRNFARCSIMITHGSINTSCQFNSKFRLHFYSGIREQTNAAGRSTVGDTLYTDTALAIIRGTTCPGDNISEVLVSENQTTGEPVVREAASVKHYVVEPNIRILNYNINFDFNKVDQLYTG